MHLHWIAASSAGMFALYVAYSRRYTWRHEVHGTNTQALTFLGGGLVLIGPIGEVGGDALRDLTDVWNVEDILGHAMLVVACFLLCVNALRLVGANAYVPAIANWATLFIVILAAGFTWTDMGDANYQLWDQASYIYWSLLPAYAAPVLLYCAKVNFRVYRETSGYYKRQGLLQSSAFLIAAIGSVTWPLGFMPNEVMYYALALFAIGMSRASQNTWHRLMTAPIPTH